MPLVQADSYYLSPSGGHVVGTVANRGSVEVTYNSLGDVVVTDMLDNSIEVAHLRRDDFGSFTTLSFGQVTTAQNIARRPATLSPGYSVFTTFDEGGTKLLAFALRHTTGITLGSGQVWYDLSSNPDHEIVNRVGPRRALATAMYQMRGGGGDAWARELVLDEGSLSFTMGPLFIHYGTQGNRQDDQLHWQAFSVVDDQEVVFSNWTKDEASASYGFRVVHYSRNDDATWERKAAGALGSTWYGNAIYLSRPGHVGVMRDTDTVLDLIGVWWEDARSPTPDVGYYRSRMVRFNKTDETFSNITNERSFDSEPDEGDQSGITYAVGWEKEQGAAFWQPSDHQARVLTLREKSSYVEGFPDDTAHNTTLLPYPIDHIGVLGLNQEVATVAWIASDNVLRVADLIRPLGVPYLRMSRRADASRSSGRHDPSVQESIRNPGGGVFV